MPRQSCYSLEVRERAVRMVMEHRDEYSSEWAAMTSVASKFELAPETLRTWVRRAQVDDGRRPGLTTDERQRRHSSIGYMTPNEFEDLFEKQLTNA